MRVYSLYEAVFQNDTLYGTVTRKHRKWVSTSEKPPENPVCRQAFFVAVFACREESRTLFWEYPNPLPVPRKNIFKNFASVFSNSPLAAVVVAKGRTSPFPSRRKGGEAE